MKDLKDQLVPEYKVQVTINFFIERISCLIIKIFLTLQCVHANSLTLQLF